MLIFFSVSTKIITEYYFTSVNMVIFAILILLLSYFYKFSQKTKILVIVLLIGLMLKGILGIIFYNSYNNLGYKERKEVAQFIATDAKTKNYPCVAISYVANPGLAFGFRYLFYLENLKVKKPLGGAPIYSIVIPESISQDVEKRYGSYGIIVEEPKNSPAEIAKACEGENINLTDSMFGYTE